MSHPYHVQQTAVIGAVTSPAVLDTVQDLGLILARLADVREGRA
ncbi:hypothetical protein [Pseudomonas asplenii]|nr:hypothetical protein [Pseudomonas fuscovaginae]KPA94393.1 hypothetical protein PF70_05635 [Pseudomonas fuscovaginae]